MEKQEIRMNYDRVKQIFVTFQDEEAVCLINMRFVCVNRNRRYVL